MNKCDFCTQSKPDGGCPWSSTAYREPYCRSALDRMVMAMNGTGNMEKDRKGRKRK